MTRLSQINALVAGEKKRSDEQLTKLYHRVQQNNALLGGLIRTYQPDDDDGEQLQPEGSKVQTRIEADILPGITSALSRMMDLQFTQDANNANATGDVIVNGQVLIAAAPVTYLLWLEKTLVHIRTILAKLPTLDPAETWTWDAGQRVWRSEPTRTYRAKKVFRNHVKAEPTDRHPAQVEVFSEDVRVGTWTAVKLSGAAPAELVQLLDDRVGKLIDAVRVARDEANILEVVDVYAAGTVFGFLFGGTSAIPARVD